MSHALCEIIDAVKILSPSAFTFADSSTIEVHAFAEASWPLPDVLPRHRPLVGALLRTFYDQCYARPFRGVMQTTIPPLIVEPAFLARLEEANRGSRRREGSGQPGFYFAFGDTSGQPLEVGPSLRVYFHATADGALVLLESLTVHLNRCAAPFRIKCLGHPKSFDRTDSFVLYLARRRFELLASWLAGASDTLAAALRPGTPLFTKEVYPGVGLAEDPFQGESFGQSRCRLVAQGLVEAWEQGRHATDEKGKAIQASFLRNGLDLDRPYLNPGSPEFPELANRMGNANRPR